MTGHRQTHQAKHPLAGGRLVLAVFAPALAWAFFHIVAWSMVPAVCETGLDVLILGVAILSILVALGGGLVSWRIGPGWPSLRGSQDERTQGDPSAWLAVFGVFLSVIFTISIISSVAGLFVLDACTL